MQQHMGPQFTVSKSQGIGRPLKEMTPARQTPAAPSVVQQRQSYSQISATEEEGGHVWMWGYGKTRERHGLNREEIQMRNVAGHRAWQTAGAVSGLVALESCEMFIKSNGKHT